MIVTPYLVPKQPVKVEQSVKRSLFICSLFHAGSREVAGERITEIRSKHADANHNCWAFIAGSPADHNCRGMSDDGEPKGCAGRPMLSVLEHSGIGEICVVVTRYFGGIKLGTGGMARAYSSTVQLGLKSMETITRKFYEKGEVIVDYEMLERVLRFLKNSDVQIKNQEFNQQVNLRLNLPQGKKKSIEQALLNLTHGVVKIR